MRKVQRRLCGDGVQNTVREGCGGDGAADVPGPPPGAPIRTAWIAGRVALAFTDLEDLEQLDVDDRPYVWDL